MTKQMNRNNCFGSAVYFLFNAFNINAIIRTGFNWNRYSTNTRNREPCGDISIGRDDDFRKGQVYFYFDAPNYLHYYFDPHFADVRVGRIHDHLFTDTLDWFVLTGVKE